MTSFDSMAYSDPVGAAQCRDAGRFGEPHAGEPSPANVEAMERYWRWHRKVCRDPGCPCNDEPVGAA